ncbi:Hypothetical predicted protein [Xyrichtys novacula]|uniref:Uncharacterized protein n=1 Tax=Xyrichtys novacula TaxID=13765 RepID=A0AAV1G3R8_XYRNO|nr:Hypothetical predicted protein [Xyrichtys novacula]
MKRFLSGGNQEPQRAHLGLRPPAFTAQQTQRGQDGPRHTCGNPETAELESKPSVQEKLGEVCASFTTEETQRGARGAGGGDEEEMRRGRKTRICCLKDKTRKQEKTRVQNLCPCFWAPLKQMERDPHDGPAGSLNSDLELGFRS